MKELMKVLEKKFKANQNKQNIEVELRFGRCVAKGGFESNVGKGMWEKAFRALNNFKEWEKVVKTNTIVYSNESGKRVIVDESTGDTTVHIKKKIFKSDVKLKEKPLDIRVSISSEEPSQQGDDEMTTIRRRNRTSFIRKNLSIDMTIVDGSDDPDSEDSQVYQIEFEVVDPKLVADSHQLFNVLYKAECLLQTLI